MIRPAEPEDAKAVAVLIVQAMGELASKFSNSDDQNVAISLFEHFFKEKENQYSFENTLVYENECGILGSINAYDGGKLAELKAPFLNYLIIHNNQNDFNPEPETDIGEFYFDTISVNPNAQGQGIGKLLINAGIDWAKRLKHKRIGLLVETNNRAALNLYQKLGFAIEDEKKFIGCKYYHMSLKIP